MPRYPNLSSTTRPLTHRTPTQSSICISQSRNDRLTGGRFFGGVLRELASSSPQSRNRGDINRTAASQLREEDRMDRIVAYCGLVCSECPAYVATQANDPDELERVAAGWREQFDSPEITAESILCDGCLRLNGGRLAGYCSICEIRSCALERGVTNCAHCADYACGKLAEFFTHAPDARTLLDELRATVQ